MYSIHKSGSRKRKEHQLREEQKRREVAKLRKLDNFFQLETRGHGDKGQGEAMQSTSTTELLVTPDQILAESEFQGQSDATQPTSTTEPLVAPDQIMAESEFQSQSDATQPTSTTEPLVAPDRIMAESEFQGQSDATQPTSTTEPLVAPDQIMAESEFQGQEVGDENRMAHTELKEAQLSSDIGLWGDNISEDMRRHWIAKGSKDCRNWNKGFENSSVIHAKEGYRRYCSKSFFMRVHPLTGELAERTWLCYSPSNGRVYCFACKLTAQTRSNFIRGFNNWKHAEDRISSHENSQQHREAMVVMVTRQANTGCVDRHVALQFENERQYWRKVLERAVCVITFLCERGLPLRGRDEIIGSPSNGNYLGVLEVLAKYDAFLDEHIKRFANKGKGHVSYLSSTTCEELISLMGNKVLETIIQEMKSAKFYSISVDSTPDVTHSDQLTFVVRYVLPTGPEERFLKFLPIIGHTGQEIAKLILTFLDENGVDIHNCRGQSYDNAPNMSGKYNGVQTIIKEQCPYATFIPCAAHSLNLVGKNSAECSPVVVRFFDILQKLYTFLSASTYRWRLLCEKLKPLGLSVVKQLSATRWSARYEAVSALMKGYNPICEVLEFLASDLEQKGECQNEAQSILDKLGELDSAILISIWKTVLDRFHMTNLSLQVSGLDLNVVVSLLESLVDFVQTQRTEFEVFENQGIQLCGHSKYNSAKRRVRVPNRRYDDGDAENTVLSPKDKFKTEVFLVIIDQLINTLKFRLEAYKEISNKFGFLSKLVALTTHEIKQAAANLVRSYPYDLEPTVENEFIQFSSLLSTSLVLQPSISSEQTKSPEIKMFQFLHAHELTQTFPNIEIALRIYLSLMVTNCSGERSFSKLKRIKDEVRNRMGQDRLSSLSIMCIESEILRGIDFSKLIDEFSRKKCRKRPM